MTSFVSEDDYREAFRRRFSPRFAAQVLGIIESSTHDARDLCERIYPAGNFGVTQGVIRWQFIDDRSQSTPLDGGVVAESRDFTNGEPLTGNERRNKITVLRSNEVAAVICKVDRLNPLPKEAMIKRWMASLPFASTPLFLDDMYRAHMPLELKAVYFITYCLDEADNENRNVCEIEVVMLNSFGKAIHCKICDLREYAIEASTPYTYDEPLPLSFRDYEPAEDGQGDDESDDLDISRRDDLDD